MIDPNFDPLEALERAHIEIAKLRHDVRQLIKAHNNQDQLMLDLVNQHQLLVNLIKETRDEIELLKILAGTRFDKKNKQQ